MTLIQHLKHQTKLKIVIYTITIVIGWLGLTGRVLTSWWTAALFIILITINFILISFLKKPKQPR